MLVGRLLARNCLPDLFLFSWSVFSHAFFARPAAPAAVSRESKKNKLHVRKRREGVAANFWKYRPDFLSMSGNRTPAILLRFIYYPSCV